MRYLLAVLLLAAITLIPARAFAAYTPPPIAGYVTDAAGKLTPAQVQALDQKLSDYRKCSTNHVAVFYPKSLDGNPIADVAYTTFNTWHIGDAKKDNGVLLVLAPNERQIRIEVGKGVEGDLTDIESSHILKETVGPNMKADKFFEAADQATTRIGKELGGCAMTDIGTQPGLATTVAPASSVPAPTETTSTPPEKPFYRESFGRVMLNVPIVFFLVLFSFIARRDYFGGFVSAFITAIASFLVPVLFGAFLQIGDWIEVLSWLFVLYGIGSNIYHWRRRILGIQDPPRAAYHGNSTGVGGSSDWSSSSSSTASSSSSFGSSSSFDSSSSSSSSSSGSDTSYSGGGGTSGGGGSSDSY